MSDQPDRIVVTCPCGARMRVKGEAVGRKVRCPKCNETFRVADPGAVDTEADGEGDFGMMEELAAQADLAPPATPSQPMITCPNCMVKMPADSRMCMSCGYDTTTGKVRKGTTAKSADRAAKVKRLAGGAGRLAMGTLFSGIGALIGAGVWIAVALLANLEIGWIAWGVGLLAGYGMRLGRSDAGVKGGIIAASMSLVGIVIAKVVVFGVLIYGMMTGDTANVNLQRAYVAIQMTEEALDERGIWSEADREKTFEKEYERAFAVLENLSDEAIHRRWQQYGDAASEEEENAKVIQLAGHYSTLRAHAAGLSYRDEKQTTLFEEEQARFAALSPEEIETELAALQSWEEGERWSDEPYVRHFLIYERVDGAVDQWYEENEPPVNEESELDEEDFIELPEADWREIYTKAAAEVDAMTPEARLAEARKIEADRERAYEELVAGFETEAGESETADLGFGEALFAFIFSAFGLFDLLFIAFAVYTAFKVASGTAS